MSYTDFSLLCRTVSPFFIEIQRRIRWPRHEDTDSTLPEDRASPSADEASVAKSVCQILGLWATYPLSLCVIGTTPWLHMATTHALRAQIPWTLDFCRTLVFGKPDLRECMTMSQHLPCYFQARSIPAPLAVPLSIIVLKSHRVEEVHLEVRYNSISYCQR